MHIPRVYILELRKTNVCPEVTVRLMSLIHIDSQRQSQPDRVALVLF